MKPSLLIGLALMAIKAQESEYKAESVGPSVNLEGQGAVSLGENSVKDSEPVEGSLDESAYNDDDEDEKTVDTPEESSSAEKKPQVDLSELAPIEPTLTGNEGNSASETESTIKNQEYTPEAEAEAEAETGTSVDAGSGSDVLSESAEKASEENSNATSPPSGDSPKVETPVEKSPDSQQTTPQATPEVTSEAPNSQLPVNNGSSKPNPPDHLELQPDSATKCPVLKEGTCYHGHEMYNAPAKGSLYPRCWLWAKPTCEGTICSEPVWGCYHAINNECEWSNMIDITKASNCNIYVNEVPNGIEGKFPAYNIRKKRVCRPKNKGLSVSPPSYDVKAPSRPTVEAAVPVIESPTYNPADKEASSPNPVVEEVPASNPEVGNYTPQVEAASPAYEEAVPLTPEPVSPAYEEASPTAPEVASPTAPESSTPAYEATTSTTPEASSSAYQEEASSATQEATSDFTSEQPENSSLSEPNLSELSGADINIEASGSATEPEKVMNDSSMVDSSVDSEASKDIPEDSSEDIEEYTDAVKDTNQENDNNQEYSNTATEDSSEESNLSSVLHPAEDDAIEI